jgi:hypothetical protein
LESQHIVDTCDPVFPARWGFPKFNFSMAAISRKFDYWRGHIVIKALTRSCVLEFRRCSGSRRVQGLFLVRRSLTLDAIHLD